ncbi:MAG: type III-B CRISPR module RAMP protein Cmr6 [Candidatus Altiarchaeales archaeon WOR_SM1_79]|nr:MAG: type III-B CRISPR module RAMP protein Cmr6 [Candidatus Altiarchaeales archaeon WOR_SM1_79]
MNIPLPNKIRNSVNELNNPNLSLRYYKWAGIYNNDYNDIPAENKKEFFEFFTESLNKKAYDTAFSTRKKYLDKIGIHFELTTASRLVFGVGYQHPVEIGFMFDWTSGLPIIPGSSIKGDALKIAKLTYDKFLFNWNDVPGKDNERIRKYLKDDLNIKWVENAKIEKNNDSKDIIITRGNNSAIFKLNEEKNNVILKIIGGETHEYSLKKEEGKISIYRDKKVEIEGLFSDNKNFFNDKKVDEIFGSQQNAGKIIFLPAYPVIDENTELFELDVMTPHYGPYYSNSKNPPADWYSTIPINFLTVKREIKYCFGIADRLNLNEKNSDLEKVKTLLEYALTEFGVGAKTSVFYGSFKK